MPTEHKKSKSKPTATVDIKVEAQDLHPLSHYIDDRVELIRQIFMSLKSKTIKSIAPDFLQGQSLETIQEHCLDELLGISTKRLQSIINATQCPENTDSSDSDVEKIEEHISLEEISSDSDDDAMHAKKSKSKSKAPLNKNKNGTAETAGSGKKEISVLELLELQARARAIRSQLALEPVTKIELDSDNDSVSSSSSKVVKDSVSTGAAVSGNNNTHTNKEKSATKGDVQETNGMQIIKPNVPKVKPVRLKRNFRQRQNEDYDPDEDDERKSVENCDVDQKLVDENDEKSASILQSNEEKKTEIERSPSPDLIPIVQEPETYCISSDSDEGSSSVPKYITYPTVVKENLPETEDEKFLKKIKEGSGVDLRDLIKARKGVKSVENSQDKIENTKTTSIATVQNTTQNCVQQDDNLATTSNRHLETEDTPANQSVQQVDKDTEPEEGELTDGDDQEEMEADEITILSSDDEINGKQSTDNKSDSEIVENDGSKSIEEESSSGSSSSNNDSDSDSSVATTFKEADDDDDIIDLGKDEELDFEMKEVEQSDSKTKKVKKTKKKVKVVEPAKLKVVEPASDCLSLKTTEDLKIVEAKDNETVAEEMEITESTDNTVASKEKDSLEIGTEGAADTLEGDTWQTRWLRGRNVTKVMATSRLANKVRTKIKQKKSKSEQETVNQESADSPTAPAVTITPTPIAEEGSVQHYEELVAQETDTKIE